MREEGTFSEVWAGMKGGEGQTDGVRMKGVRSRSFGTNGSSDPGGVFADICVDSWVLGSTTWVNAP